MGWPLSQDYNEAIQSPASCFSDAQLRQGEPRLTPLGLPLPRSGNFADVYEVTCPDGSRWAVKCFTRQVPSLAQRYAAISRHLQAVKLPFMVDFHFLEQGIRIRGQWYPVLKMRWVEGQLLNEIVRDNLDKPAVLEHLLRIWARMAKRLREAEVAHADLQHGNVIFVPGSTTRSLAVKLIDYDGMYVPALASNKSGEVGHPSYQHPQRLREGTWSAEVDRTPLLVVATAMRALAVGGRALWQKYDNGDNLLFRESDLRTPSQSALFAELEGMADPLTRKLTSVLRQACAGPIDQVPLLDGLLPEERITKAAAAAGKNGGTGSQWDFGDDEEERPVRRRRKGGVPGWAWAASVGVAVLAAAVGGVMAFRGNDEPRPSNNGPLANNTTPTTGLLTPPTTQPKPPPTTKPVKPPDPVVNPPIDPKPNAAGPLFTMIGTSDDLLALAEAGSKSWDLVSSFSKDRLHTFTGHDGPITCFASTPDGHFTATGSEDCTVRVWDLKAKKESVVLRGHTKGVTAVALSANGQRVASAAGGEGKVWDVGKDEPVATYPNPAGVSALALSSDGTYLARAFGKGPRANRHVLEIYDFEARQGKAASGSFGEITTLAFSPDDKLLVAGGADGAVRLWDVIPFQRHGQDNTISGLTAPIRRITFYRDGALMLAETGHESKVIGVASHKVLGGPGGAADVPLTVGLYPEANQTADVRLEKGQVTRGGSTFNKEEPVVVKPPMPPATVDFDLFRMLTPTGNEYVTNLGRGKVVQVNGIKEKATLAALMHDAPVTCFATTPDGSRILTGCQDGKVYVHEWSPLAQVYKAQASQQPLVALAISGNGGLAATSDGGAEVVLWDVNTKAELRRLAARGATALAFSPDGKFLACAVPDPRDKKASHAQLFEVETGTPAMSYPAVCGRPSVVAFSPQKDVLALSGSSNEPWLLRKSPGGTGQGTPAIDLRKEPVAGNIDELQFSGDGTKLLVSGPREAVVLATQGLKVLKRQAVPEGKSQAAVMTFKGDKVFLALRGADGSIERQTVPIDAEAPPVVNPKRPRRPVRPGGESAVERRRAVPDKTELASAQKKLIDELSVKKPTNLQNFLYNLGTRFANDEASLGYVALVRLRDDAAERGDVIGALNAVHNLALRFAIDTLLMQCEAVETAGRKADPKTCGSTFLLGDVFKLVENARAEERYELGERLALAAARLAIRGHNQPWAEHARKFGLDATARKRELDSVKSHLDVLRTSPDDPKANLEVGRYRCFIQGNWDAGLPLLSKGSDEELRAMADNDLAMPDDATACAVTGDEWLARANKAVGVEQTACRKRAYHWYREALARGSSAPADLKAKIGVLESQLPELTDRWADTLLTGQRGPGGAVHLEAGQFVSTKKAFRGGVDITIEVMPESDNVQIEAGDSGSLSFRVGGKRGRLTICIPDGNGGLHGGGVIPGVPTVSLSAKSWSTIRWRLTPGNLEVFVNDKKVFGQAVPNRMDLPRPVRVRSSNGAMDVRLLKVQPAHDD